MSLDLSTLPTPAVVETLDYEAVLSALRADLLARHPDVASVLALESEPINKLLQVAAYRELLLRARINDAARAVLLPWAVGTDLDNLAARYDLARLPAEDDDRLRARTLIGYHALSAAGSPASWRLRALSQSNDIRQADVWADRPGRVKIALLARVAATAYQLTPAQVEIGYALFGPHPQNGLAWHAASAQDPIVTSAEAALLADDVRPLTVEVDVTAATVRPVEITATLVHPPAQDGALLRARATQRLQALAAASTFRVDLTRAAITAALMGDGIRDVVLTSPAADVPAGPGEIVAITGANLTTQARND